MTLPHPRSSLCKVAITQLKLDLAGRHTWVEDVYLRDVMCAPECEQNDQLHLEVIARNIISRF